MRLIDADSIVESVSNLIANGHSVAQALDAQPTAFDVDAVLEELRLECFQDVYGDVSFWTIDKIFEKGGVK